MKKLSQIIKEAKQKLDIQDDTINYISTEDLIKYVEIANKFLSADAKNIINWLIAHPNYVEDLANKNADNALATFYDNGVPTTPMMKELYRWVGNVVKSNRLLEIPVFQTKEQFDAILNKTVAPDEVIIDLSTERGRNDVAKKYDSLVWKIARDFIGKSNFDLEELHAIGLHGLADAMNTYGKKSSKSDASDEKVKGYTFLSWAGYRIRIYILEYIKDQGHLVRIPRSQQAKERKEKGHNTRNTSISVETPVGKDKEGNTKRLLDKVGDYERAGKSLEERDNERLWAEIDNKLRKKFDDRTLDIFYSWFGLFGYEKLSGKEIMAKYGFKNPSNINANNYKVMKYMKEDPEMLDALKELYEFMSECQHDDDVEDRDNEPLRIPGLRFNEDEETNE
jgi:DNA-directed RNA polymerase specialized sigma subunit